MDESNRNTRTLIVSFVFAIMAMIPLRFVEAGQMMQSSFTPASRSAVLGEMEERVVLPNAELNLESPYNVIDAVPAEDKTDCLSKTDADILVRLIGDEISSEELASDELDELVNEIKLVQESVCEE